MKRLHYLFLCLAFSFIACSDDPAPIEEELIQTEGSTITQQILVLINKHRSDKGLTSLSRNATADKLAKDHNIYMIDNDVVNHDHFEQRASALKNDEEAKGVGENVAWGYQDAQSVVDAWLDSPGHRANIEGDFNRTGLSALKDDGGTYYFTHLFFKN